MGRFYPNRIFPAVKPESLRVKLIPIPMELPRHTLCLRGIIFRLHDGKFIMKRRSRKRRRF